MTYEETVSIIVNKAINSVVFIDENAKEPYSPTETNEAKRCVELYNLFRKNGMSLSIYQYDEKTYDDEKDYLFRNRDLVLLDWKLEGDEGSGEKSLEILSEIVSNWRHIHFCVIYTSETKKDLVYQNILSYFSGSCQDEYKLLKNYLEDEEDEIKSLEPLLIELLVCQLDRNRAKNVMGAICKNNQQLVEKIQKEYGGDRKLALIKCGIAFSNLITSKSKEPTPSSIDASTYTLNINNTIIAILNKDEINTNDVLQKFVENIANYKWGVMQLLGLEMRNIVKTKEAFVSQNVLQVTKESLGFHKKNHLEFFDSFLKSVMLEQEALALRPEKLSLVEAIDVMPYNEALNSEYVSMNIFYNSTYIANDKVLSFGDVFKFGQNYYICITALCDCVRPEKRNNMFYFAMGESIKVDKALLIGDEGFISYIGPNECIKWNTSRDDDTNTPTYIIPLSYCVPNNKIQDGKLHILRFNGDDMFKVEDCLFEYITTIKQNYAQRIANHAFSHPVRVGIDFVKKEKD